MNRIAGLSSNNYLQRQKDKTLKHYLSVYRSLDPGDQVVIDGVVEILTERVNGMGVASALMLVGKLGEFLAKR